MSDESALGTGEFEFSALTDVTMMNATGEQTYIYSGSTLTWSPTEVSWSSDNSELLEAMDALQRQKECRIPTFKSLDEMEQGRLEQVMQSGTIYVREVRPENDNATSLNDYTVKVELSNTKDFLVSVSIIEGTYQTQGNLVNMGEAVRTLCLMMTFQGHDVILDGKAFRPYDYRKGTGRRSDRDPD